MIGASLYTGRVEVGSCLRVSGVSPVALVLGVEAFCRVYKRGIRTERHNVLQDLIGVVA